MCVKVSKLWNFKSNYIGLFLFMLGQVRIELLRLQKYYSFVIGWLTNGHHLDRHVPKGFKIREFLVLETPQVPLLACVLW